jgi:hypothetical protein
MLHTSHGYKFYRRRNWKVLYVASTRPFQS